jgi:hypothetical protein
MVNQAICTILVQRFYGFGICFTVGFLISFCSTFLLFGGNVTGFAVLYTIGNIVSLVATGFLTGFFSQFKVSFLSDWFLSFLSDWFLKGGRHGDITGMLLLISTAFPFALTLYSSSCHIDMILFFARPFTHI